MATRSVVVGCRDPARVWAFAQAIDARSALPTAVSAIWPLERALASANAEVAVVVLDGFPSRTGLRAMARITGDRPELGVLVLGPLDPNIDVLIALASGASGYLPSSSTSVAVADAVDALLAGDVVLPGAVSLPLVRHLRWGGRGIVVGALDGRPVELTHREWEVYLLLRQAHSTAEIARRLVVSNGTVRTHVAALVHKLGAVDRAALDSARRVERRHTIEAR
jgi:DNA-binding NarL/FixJ family response regulator